ncbi:MAG: hypothetical protein GY827_07090 [Cytophagales bacterium]|nr:hypothetical protein [Cytophagales bacterium]
MLRAIQLVLLAGIISSQTNRDNSCYAYKAILDPKNNSFGAYQTPNTSQYYSQAPNGDFVGKCNSVPCVGSPIFLIEKAHTYINQQFDLQNKYSSVRYLCYHKNTAKASSNSVLYRFIFELSHYGGSKYIGVEVDTPISGLANASYNRFILHKDLKLVKEVLGVPGLVCEPRLTCGDLKLYYSYYGRDSENDLNYPYAGKNYNEVEDYLMNQINKENDPNFKKVCSNQHYFRVFNRNLGNYFRDETLSITPPIRENFYCNPSGLGIARIRVACRTEGKYTADNFEAFQLIRIDPVTGDLEAGPVQGNVGIADRYFMDIALNGASEVQFEFWGADQLKKKN